MLNSHVVYYPSLLEDSFPPAAALKMDFLDLNKEVSCPCLEMLSSNYDKPICAYRVFYVLEYVNSYDKVRDLDSKIS